MKYDTSRFEVKQLQTGSIAVRLYEIGIKQLPRVDASTLITIYSPLTNSNAKLDVNVKGHIGAYRQIIKQAEATEDKEPLLLYFFGTTGIWFIGYTIIIATFVLIVILYHFIKPEIDNLHLYLSHYRIKYITRHTRIPRHRISILHYTPPLHIRPKVIARVRIPRLHHKEHCSVFLIMVKIKYGIETDIELNLMVNQKTTRKT